MRHWQRNIRAMPNVSYRSCKSRKQCELSNNVYAKGDFHEQSYGAIAQKKVYDCDVGGDEGDRTPDLGISIGLARAWESNGNEPER